MSVKYQKVNHAQQIFCAKGLTVRIYALNAILFYCFTAHIVLYGLRIENGQMCVRKKAKEGTPAQIKTYGIEK